MSNAPALLDEKGFDLPIHHRHPLEYAHLFPEEDINARDNLAMAHLTPGAIRSVLHLKRNLP